MSAITLTAASWISYLAQTTASNRAAVVAGWFPSGATIEFLDADDAVIRTVTTASWSVAAAQGTKYPVVPGTYTDSATGSGTPVTAVFKDGSTERFRCTCGTSASDFYRLSANIVAGVPIRRGSFAILIDEPPAPGNTEPVNTAAPVVSGTASIGSVLTCTAGTWTGNPVPSVTRQWYRGSTAISGATGLGYTLVSADIGALITCVESATNLVATNTATSNAIGPVIDGSLNVTSIPSPIRIPQGGSFNFDDYITGGTPPYTVSLDSGSLPSGVTKTGNILSATGSATITTTSALSWSVVDSEVSATLPTFGVLSTVGGTNLPFTYGHVFKEGDVPSGQYVNSDLTDWQCVPTTYWPDGSVRHAIISGRATCTSNVLKSIALSVSSSDRSGTTLTETNLASALPTVTLQAGGDSFTLNSLVGTSAKHRTVCTGPVMSNWIYRRAISGSNHLVAWFDVRLYVGGNVEIFPWVENAYLTVASPVNDVRTWTLTIGGVQKFSQSIDVKHHSRPVLVSGAPMPYWTGTDPQIVPKHDVAYLRATKMVPNYGWTSPSASKLNGLQQTYTPNTLAGINSAMGAAGSSAAILNNADALYAASGDSRAWKASVVFAMSGGSWSIHHRAEATSTQGSAGYPNEPFMFSQYPNASIQIQNSPTIPEGSGGTNGTPVISHQPNYGYLQWLCSARWWFLEETLFWGGWNYLYNTVDNRKGAGASGANGVIKTSAGANTDRGGAWGLRTLAQGFVSVPSTHPCYSSLKTSWEANTSWYKALTIDGTVEGGSDVNSLGIMGFYGSFSSSVYSAGNSSTEMYGAGWMQGMFQHVLGFTWDLSLPQDSASQTRHQAIRDLGYTAVVARTGDGSGNSWRYRNFIVYGLNWGTIGGSYYSSWDGAYAKYKAGFGITNDGDGGTSLFSHSSQTVLAPGSSSKPYFGQALTALAYAVDHGKTGASAGWARVSGASNFDSYTAAEFNDEPEHGVIPRT